MYISYMTLIIPILQVRSLTHLQTVRVADTDLSKVVFRNLSFDIYQGETVGLHGGRMERVSVLMQCLAKLIKPAEGRIVWNICSDPQRRFPDIAYLPDCPPGHQYFRAESHFHDSEGEGDGVGAMLQPVTNMPTVFLIDGVADLVSSADQLRLRQLFRQLNVVGKTVIIGSDRAEVLKELTSRIIPCCAAEKGKGGEVLRADLRRYNRLTSLSDQSPLS